MQVSSLTLKQHVNHIDMTNGAQVREVLLRMAKAIDAVTPKKEYKLWSKNSKERAAAAEPKKHKLWSKNAK